jgi:hypothetical protein
MVGNPVNELFNRILLFGETVQLGTLPAPYNYQLQLGAGGTTPTLGTFGGVATFTIAMPIEFAGDEVDFAIARVIPVPPVE